MSTRPALLLDLLSAFANHIDNTRNTRPLHSQDHDRYRSPNDRHNNNGDQSPKASAFAFLAIIVSIFLLVLLSHFFYLYVIRKEPYYYSVQSDVDPTLWHVERVVPLRERLRSWRGLPRSNSDIFRDEDLERVRRALMVRGWRGRVNSDGTPNRNHRIVDDRAAVGYGVGGGTGWGYPTPNDIEHGPRQYVETEDTPFWKERRWGYNYGTYGSAFGTSPSDERRKMMFAYPIAPRTRGGNVVPGMSSSRWPTGVVTPEFGSVGKMVARGDAHAYGLAAAFSYHPSPRNTRFVTPPIRASSKILEELKHTGMRYAIDRNARFPDEDLQEHYQGLCESEDAALRDLEDARDAAAVEHTYVPAAQQEPDHAQRIVEKLTEMEKKLLHAVKRRALFAERFALRDDGGEMGESSRGPSVSEPPPPYSDIDESGLHFDEDN
ncbi:hypothetical protein H072_8192 [Dactylellina haptotyla CBS 200.50]|uniref:Uncharacterized protein n=1 Tax=Dactylellina haptotyla (strain CBS 200.50) TaxID=1284197 RepID=S8AAE2_DACHA|nr:hypothetical protein H072_8192 [Dactylellina haptotyla CBS 200.50]